MTNQDTTAIDSLIFTFVGATSVFTINTTDISKVATYPLTLEAKYFETSCSPVCSGTTPCKNDGTDVCSAYDSGTTCPSGNTDCSTTATVVYPVAGTLDFNAEISNSCTSVALTIAASILSSTTIDYEITDPTTHTETFAQTDVTASVIAGICPTTYVFTVVNQDDSAIDSSVFTYDGATSVFTIELADSSKVA